MKRTIVCMAVLCLLAGCREKLSVEQGVTEAPTILSFAPTEGEAGTEVTILGTHLGEVDSVWLGDVLLPLRYRVSAEEMVVEISTTAQTGRLVVKNSAGVDTAQTLFTVQYAVPVVYEWPTEGTVYEQLVLEGENLQIVDQVRIGEQAATIVAKRKNELTFEVPFRDDETPVAIRLSYFDVDGEQVIGPQGETFVVQKQSPKITDCPTSLTKYSPITITGELLSLFDSIKAGEQRLQIVGKNDEALQVDLPADYYGGEMTADLVGWYYGTKKMVLCPSFTVISDPNEPRYRTYKNVVLSGRSSNGGEDMPFFVGETGTVVSTCDAEGQMMAIDFLLYDNTGYAQLYSPSNSANTLKNFKCEGVSIVSDATVWADFFKVDTKFRILNPATEAEKAVIDAYEAGTIVTLDDAFFEGISEPAAKAPKVYQSDATGKNLSVDAYPYCWAHNFRTGKNGLLKIQGVRTSEETGKTYEVTCDIIWEK